MLIQSKSKKLLINFKNKWPDINNLAYIIEMILRHVLPQDYEAWYALWQQYNLFYNRNIEVSVSQLTWGRFLDSAEPMFAIIAIIDEKIVGFTTYLFHRNTAMKNNTCYLQDLFVDDNYRGKGIGKSLILSVSESAKKFGSMQVYWMTHESNSTARNLYNDVAKYSGFIVYSKNLKEN